MFLEKRIKKPVITEKSMHLEKENKYVMAVLVSATKGMIANELKSLFGVDVLNVRTMVMPGKRKDF